MVVTSPPSVTGLVRWCFRQLRQVRLLPPLTATAHHLGHVVGTTCRAAHLVIVAAHPHVSWSSTSGSSPWPGPSSASHQWVHQQLRTLVARPASTSSRRATLARGAWNESGEFCKDQPSPKAGTANELHVWCRLKPGHRRQLHPCPGNCVGVPHLSASRINTRVQKCI